jgi:hypothetical protein
MPKRLGGVGIKDPEKFSTALRLRWLWYGWGHKERPWKQLLKIDDPIDSHKERIPHFERLNG